MSKRKRMRLATILVAFAALIGAVLGGGGCAEKITGAGNTGGGTVTLDLGDKAGPAVAILLTISAADMDTLRLPRILADGTEFTFPVPFGSDRHFVIEVLDFKGTVLYRGETTRDVVSLVPLELNIDLEPMAPMFYLNPHFSAINVGDDFELTICVNNLPELTAAGFGLYLGRPVRGDKLSAPALVDTVLLDVDQLENGTLLYYDNSGTGGVYFDLYGKGGSLVDENGDACLVTVFCRSQDTWPSEEIALTASLYIEYLEGVEIGPDLVLDTAQIRLIRETTPESYLDSGGSDAGVSLVSLDDGGVMVAGTANILEPGEEGPTSYLYLNRLDADLQLQFQSLIPWSFVYTTEMARAAGGGFYAVAQGNFEPGAVLRADDEGAEVWRRLLGQAVDPFAVAARPDGGCIVAGRWPNDGYHFYLAAYDESGEAVYYEPSNFSADEEFRSVVALNDTTFVAVGTQREFSNANQNIVLGKYTVGARFTEAWQLVYSTDEFQEARDLLVTPDGGFLVVGSTTSPNGGPAEIHVFKTDAEGTVAWSRDFGGLTDDGATAVTMAGDGGYVLTGYTGEFYGPRDVLIAKLSADGEVLWQRTLGGPGNELGEDIIRFDNGYLITGSTDYGLDGAADVLVLKVDSQGR